MLLEHCGKIVASGMHGGVVETSQGADGGRDFLSLVAQHIRPHQANLQEVAQPVTLRVFGHHKSFFEKGCPRP